MLLFLEENAIAWVSQKPIENNIIATADQNKDPGNTRSFEMLD